MPLQPKEVFLCDWINISKFPASSSAAPWPTRPAQAAVYRRVLVNGKVARASYDVKQGDVLELHLGERVLKAEVLSVLEYAKKEQAPDMYRMLEE